MAGKNTIVKTVNPAQVFPSATKSTDATVSYDQGDLLVFNGTTNLIEKPAAEADGATFLGVALVTVVTGKIKSAHVTDVDASTGISDIPGPLSGVVAKCVLKTGITIAHGDLIYLDPATGSRGVTNTGTKAIGVYQGSAITTSAEGQEIEVQLGHRFPGDSLVM